MALHADRFIGLETVAAVGDEILGDGNVEPRALVDSIVALVRDGVLSPSLAEHAARRLAGFQLFSASILPARFQ